MKLKGSLFAVLLALFVAIGVLAQNDDRSSRTYYDSLSLDTPEDAVMTFIDAFHRRDYPTVFYVFSPSAQLIFQHRVNTVRYGELVAQHVAEYLQIPGNLPNFSEWEHFISSHQFDFFMLTAEELDGFLVDLRGDVEIIRTENSTAGEIPAVDVITIVDGIDGEVRFRVVRSPLGRWRVYQVAAPGIDGEESLWALPVPLILEATVFWEMPCGDTPLEQPEQREDDPHIIIEPDCGSISLLNQDTISLLVRGSNFVPGRRVQLFYRNNALEMRELISSDNQPVFADDNGNIITEVTMEKIYEIEVPTFITIFARQEF